MPILSQGTKVILSSVLSLTAVALYLIYGGRERRLCMIAMLICTLADVFMTDIIKLGSVSTYPGAALFIAAHIVYFICFKGAIAEHGYELITPGFKAGVILIAAAAAALGILAFRFSETPQSVMFFLLLIYLAVIGLNLATQFSYAFSEGGRRLFIAAGMLLFLISDFVVFLPMLNVSPEHNDFVWFTYLPAQLLIILFNS